MNNKKIYIGIGVLFLIFLGLLFWPTNKNGGTAKDGGELKLVEPSPEFRMDSPTNISWKTEIDKNYDKAAAMLVERKVLSVEDKLTLNKAIVNGANAPNQYYNFDENRNKYEYSRNIQDESGIEKGNLDDTEIKNQFNGITTLLKEIDGLEVQIDNLSYKKYVYPWWVSSTKEKFDVVEIKADYVLNNIPVKTYRGNPIKADYFTTGKLAKIEGQLPFEKQTKVVEKKIMSLEQLKKIKQSDIKIWLIDGGESYELTEEQPKVESVEIHNYYLGYIYDFKSGTVWPYFFLEGNSKLPTGEARVTLITSATKE